jgi:uncharacterized membrane protein HdeD (DUF308 family)
MSRYLIEYLVIVIAVVFIIIEIFRLASAYRNRNKNGDNK